MPASRSRLELFRSGVEGKDQARVGHCLSGTPSRTSNGRAGARETRPAFAEISCAGATPSVSNCSLVSAGECQAAATSACSSCTRWRWPEMFVELSHQTLEAVGDGAAAAFGHELASRQMGAVVAKMTWNMSPGASSSSTGLPAHADVSVPNSCTDIPIVREN